MSDIANRVTTIFSKVLQMPAQQITNDASRNNLDSWDSLAHMNLILALEDEFGIEFSDQEIAECMDLRSLIDSVKSKKS